jgi:DNA-binding ferritin-like protein (Dps family)
MNVYQRQMFANGDEVVNVDRLIQYYTAQGYAPAEVTELVKGEFPAIETATVLDKMREARELFPVDAQRMPPTGTMDDIRRIDPNSVQFDDGSSINMSGLISNIKRDNVSAEKVLALLNAPNAKLGSNLQQEVVSYLNRNLPGYSDLIVGEPGEFTDQRKFGIGSLDKEKQAKMPFNLRSLARITAGVGAEEAREGIETLADFFGSETIGDIFRAEKYDGDPDAFIRRGGRTEPAFRDMVSDLNDPDQSMFKGARDTITGLLENLNVDTTQFSDFFGRDPSEMILETDTVQRKRFEDAQIQDQINNVSNEAEDAGQPDVNNQEVPVTVVEEDSGDDESEDPVKTPGTGEAAKPDITDGEATKRNFGEFIQSPDFIRFARNLGKGLATTGQIGQGIALGAAGAAEEKYAEQVAATEAYNELLKEEIKQGAEGALKPSELQALNKNVSEMSENIQFFEGTEASIQIMDDLIGLFENARITGGKVSGIGGQFDLYLDKLKALSGMDFDPSDATQITNAIEQVKQRSIREILNESGRTISDLDRQIVEKIFGGIDLTTAPSEIIKKLRKGRADLQNNNRDKQRKISVTYNTVIDPIYGNRGLNLILPFKDTIDKILDAKPGDNYSLTPTSSSLYPSNIIFLDKSKT